MPWGVDGALLDDDERLTAELLCADDELRLLETTLLLSAEDDIELLLLDEAITSLGALDDAAGAELDETAAALDDICDSTEERKLDELVTVELLLSEFSEADEADEAIGAEDACGADDTTCAAELSLEKFRLPPPQAKRLLAKLIRKIRAKGGLNLSMLESPVY